MEPLEYIQKFRMDQENYEFSRPDFLNQLENDFLESIYKCPEKNESNGFPEYKVFKELVKDIQTKYYLISGFLPKALSEGLWKCFFANTVVKYRRKYYPEIQTSIERRKYKAKIEKNKSLLNKTGQND